MRSLLVGAILLPVLFGAAAGTAHAKDYVWMNGAETTDGNWAVAAFVQADKPKCGKGRIVKFYRRDGKRKMRFIGRGKSKSSGRAVVVSGGPLPTRGKVVFTAKVLAKPGCRALIGRSILRL